MDGDEGARGLAGDVRTQRERLFARMIDAFLNQDYEAIDRAMRDDIVLTMPGSSPVSGTHRGRDEVVRFIVAARRAFDPGGRPITYRHSEDEMVASNDLSVRGPLHDVEMRIEVRVTFDEEGKAARVAIDPSDVGLLDHVLATALGEP